MRLTSGDDTQTVVAGGRHFERDLPRPQLLDHGRVVQAADTMPNAFGPQRGEGSAHALGAGHLPGMGGVAVGLFTAPLAIGLDALSFLASALFMRAIRTPERPPVRPAHAPSIGQDIAEGLCLVLRNPLLRAVAGQTGTGIFVSTISTTVYVLYVTRELGFSPVALGALLALGGAGALLGTVVAAPVTRRYGVGPTIIGAQVLIGLSALLVPLASRAPGVSPFPAFALLAIAQALQGVLIVIYDVNWISLLQAAVPRSVQGRVNATLGVLILSLQPVGAVLAGILGTLIGLRPTLLVAAVGWTLVFLWPLCSPLRTLCVLPTLPEPAPIPTE